MKKEINKKPPAFIAMIIFTITVLLFNGSCSKDTKGQDPGNTTTGSSKIVYKDVIPDSVIHGSYNLDLNDDGITDFAFNISSNRSVCGGDALFGYYYRDITKLSVTPANENNEVITDGTYALALDSSSAIVSDSLWATASQTLIYGALNSSGRCTIFPYGVAGHWINVSDKYLGLKFIKDNNTYYGRARLSSSYHIITGSNHLSIGQLILKDYAFNSVPNQHILAGQTK